MIQYATRLATHEVDLGFSYSLHHPLGPAGVLVEDYWEVQAARCRTAVEASLPDAGVEIFFNLGPAGRHVFAGPQAGRLAPRAAWVVGPRADTLLVAKETIDCDIVGVRLHPGMARCVLGVPARELSSSLVDLDQLWGSVVHEIRERLSETTDTRARIQIVEQAMLQRLSDAGCADEVGWIRGLCRSVGRLAQTSVAQVADRFGLSHRRVIACFDQHVGLKPKAYHRVCRLRQVMQSAGLPQRPPWTQIAIQSGFCDQAHMIHEFRRLTGLTPGAYAEQRTRMRVGFVPYRLAKAG